MHLQQRINLLAEMGNYIKANEGPWQQAKLDASINNGWFIPEFIESAVSNIANGYLDRLKLENWAKQYDLPGENKSQKQIGLVMAGNIPLVGFHDFLSIFLAGHSQMIKASSKDQVLISHLVTHLHALEPETRNLVSFGSMLRGCDAYIATGSNNTARYFDYYFAKYPHIIRRNRTSVAILDATEQKADLERLADDVYLYFGLGCRNVTKLYVPAGYDFVPLLEAFNRYQYLADHHKYKNNFDYQLAIVLLNKQYYMTNGSLLLVENKSVFSPISVLNYEYYQQKDLAVQSLGASEDIQLIVGNGFTGFGQAQSPGLTDYADGADTLKFLREC